MRIFFLIISPSRAASTKSGQRYKDGCDRPSIKVAIKLSVGSITAQLNRSKGTPQFTLSLDTFWCLSEGAGRDKLMALLGFLDFFC